MNRKTCSTCKHFRPETAKCLEPRIGADLLEQKGDALVVEGAPFVGADVYVGPDFGCVHWARLVTDLNVVFDD